MDIDALKIKAYDIYREIGILEQRARFLNQELIKINKEINEFSKQGFVDVKTKTKVKEK